MFGLRIIYRVYKVLMKLAQEMDRFISMTFYAASCVWDFASLENVHSGAILFKANYYLLHIKQQLGSYRPLGSIGNPNALTKAVLPYELLIVTKGNTAPESRHQMAI